MFVEGKLKTANDALEREERIEGTSLKKRSVRYIFLAEKKMKNSHGPAVALWHVKGEAEEGNLHGSFGHQLWIDLCTGQAQIEPVKG